jgi:hypothetical protein
MNIRDIMIIPVKDIKNGIKRVIFKICLGGSLVIGIGILINLIK